MNPPDPVEGVRLFLRATSAGGVDHYLELLDGEKPIPQVAGILRGSRIPGPLRPLVAKAMERKGQRYLAGQVRDLGRCSAGDYFDLVEARNHYRAAFWQTLDDAGIDAVICPPAALPAFTHGSSEHLSSPR